LVLKLPGKKIVPFWLDRSIQPLSSHSSTFAIGHRTLLLRISFKWKNTDPVTGLHHSAEEDLHGNIEIGGNIWTRKFILLIMIFPFLILFYKGMGSICEKDHLLFVLTKN
jgi:hypothetical protein